MQTPTAVELLQSELEKIRAIRDNQWNEWNERISELYFENKKLLEFLKHILNTLEYQPTPMPDLKKSIKKLLLTKKL